MILSSVIQVYTIYTYIPRFYTIFYYFLWRSLKTKNKQKYRLSSRITCMLPNHLNRRVALLETICTPQKRFLTTSTAAVAYIAAARHYYIGMGRYTEVSNMHYGWKENLFFFFCLCTRTIMYVVRLYHVPSLYTYIVFIVSYTRACNMKGTLEFCLFFRTNSNIRMGKNQKK